MGCYPTPQRRYLKTVIPPGAVSWERDRRGGELALSSSKGIRCLLTGATNQVPYVWVPLLG
jgi:hypothetical protein